MIHTYRELIHPRPCCPRTPDKRVDVASTCAEAGTTMVAPCTHRCGHATHTLALATTPHAVPIAHRIHLP